MTAVEVWQRDQFTTPGPPTKVADVTEAWGRSFRHAKNDYGSCTLNVQLSDTTGVAAATPGRLIKFQRDGVAHAFVLGPRRIAKVKRGEEYEQVLQVRALGMLQVLNDGRVQPENGEGWSPWDRQRRWDWTNPNLDTSSWVAATELWQQGVVGDPSATSSSVSQILNDQGRFAFTPPDGFTDPTAMWIWSSGYDGTGGTAGSGTLRMAVGTSYFHKTFTVASPVRARLVAGADDFLEVAVDGVVLFSTAPTPGNAHDHSRSQDLHLSAGTHTIRVRVENYTRSFTNGNIAGLVLAVHEVDEATEVAGSVLVHTDDTWLALDYPADPPGFTVGDILLTLLGEAQAEGFLLDVDPTFTATLDSDLAAWPEVSDVVTKVGDPLGEVLRQVCAQHADTKVNHDLTWDAWDKGTHGTASGVTLAAGVNIAELEFDGDTTPVSSLLVLHAEGFLVLGDATTGRQEFLDLSQYPEAEATTRGQAALDDMSTERWQATIAVEPTTGDAPIGDFDVLDTVTVPNPSGTTSTVECVATTWSEDEAGNEILGAEFGDVVLTADERRAQALRGATTGTLGGRVPLAPQQGGGGVITSPTGPSGGSYPVVAPTVELVFDRDAAVTDTTSKSKTAAGASTVYEIAADLGAAQGSAVDVVLNKNGTPVHTMTVPAGSTYYQEPVGVSVAKNIDILTVTCTSTGFDLVVSVRMR